MRDKITWKDLCQEFKARYPRLGKDVVHYEPNGYMSIRLRFKDGSKMVYDAFVKKARWIS